jgi:hypothetical protein
MIDRSVHHATMVPLKGKSYRLRERGTGITPQNDTGYGLPPAGST